ncbi:hypothetical protein BDV93DRAFT_519600 [Ceratobasidium sp. AG-I]|nr:hypothetical protein BDV93DRAFT_519600 [Ceratobasidium sp. AG-I]
MASAKLRLFHVLLVIFINVFTTGVIFGFAALKPVLLRKGIYSELCTVHDKINSGELPTCEKQELRLNTVFVVSVAITNMASLPAGSILDSLGPTRTSIIGASLFGVGNLIFGAGTISWPIAVDGIFIGFDMLALGSPLIFLSSFHVSNAFPHRSGLILSTIMAAFNASSTPYAIYNWVDRRTGGISLKAFFWCYVIIPALFITLQGIAGPKAAYSRESVPPANENTAISSTTVAYGATSTGASIQPVMDVENVPPQSSLPVNRGDGFVGVMFGKSLLLQIFSRHFGLLLLFFTIYADRVNWMIQTISEQLTFYLHEPSLVAKTLTKFTILLPLGGIVGVPIFGWLLDNRSVFDASLVILVSGLVYGILGMLESTIAQTVSISIFVVLRPLLYVFVGDYCGKAFGFRTFGRVYGLLNTLVGLFGLVLGPIDHWVKGPLNGNYNLINGLGLAGGLMASALLSWSIRASANKRRRLATA